MYRIFDLDEGLIAFIIFTSMAVVGILSFQILKKYTKLPYHKRFGLSCSFGSLPFVWIFLYGIYLMNELDPVVISIMLSIPLANYLIITPRVKSDLETIKKRKRH